METKIYNTIDKSAWPSGPWSNEPDKKQWPDAATGLPCLAVRHPSLGHWCGYVGVTPGHPWHGVDYSQCSLPGGCGAEWCNHSPENSIEVHGGLTFTNRCKPGEDESKGVCHVPSEGDPHDVWWFGFDCAHAGDQTSLNRPEYQFHSDDVYRDLTYVEAQCAGLARQLANVSEP